MENALIIGRQGALCGNVHYVEAPFYATEHAVVVTLKSKGNLRFYYHLLAWMDLNQYKTQSAQPGLSVSTLNQVKVPVPSLDVQNAIASTLDHIEALVEDMTRGLPAELEARRKQYAHYRDRLLSFKERPSVAGK